MVHPSALVHETVVLPANVQIWQFCNIMNGVIIHEGVSIGGNTEIGRFSVIGTHSRIGFNCFLPSRSRIGSRVFIGPSVTFCDDKYPYVSNPGYKPEPPVVEDNASIGAGAVILPGVTIGRYATVGAGAVVTHDVPPDHVVAGNPARRILPQVP